MMFEFKFNKHPIPSKLVNLIGQRTLDLCKKFREAYLETKGSARDVLQNLDEYARVANSSDLQIKYFEQRYKSTYTKPRIEKYITDPTTGTRYEYKHASLPITHLAQQVLQDKRVQDKLEKECAELNSNQNSGSNNIQTENKIYDSILSGSIVSRVQGKLKLELFIDDCQIAPSGPFNKTQKYIMVYATFADLPMEERCCRENMEMVVMANRNNLKGLKSRRFKDPLVALFSKMKSELKHLMKNGIEINVNGETKRFGFTLCTICGDNLG